MLDDRMAHASNGWASPLWPPETNRFGWDAYLAGLSPKEIPPSAAPARATDLAGLPPALMVVGALDGLVDEDVDYAMRLNHAGVPCELHVYPGGGHGLESIAPTARASTQLRRDLEHWLERALRGDLRRAG
jgi:acetyl esterase/lipase